MYNLFDANKKEIKNRQTITYKIKCIDRARFMLNFLSGLVDNLFHKYQFEVCEYCLKYAKLKTKHCNLIFWNPINI